MGQETSARADPLSRDQRRRIALRSARGRTSALAPEQELEPEHERTTIPEAELVAVILWAIISQSPRA